MADPRFYAVDVPAGDMAAVMAAARQLRSVCPHRPEGPSVRGHVSPGRLPAMVAAVPSLGIGVRMTLSPQDLARLVPLAGLS